MIGLIINPHAGNGRGSHIWTKVQERLQQLGMRYAAVQTSAAGQAAELAASLVLEHFLTTLIVIGGDGTIHEAAEGLQRSAYHCPTPCRLAVIPAGTGNDFARAYGIPGDPIQALEDALGRGTTQNIDLLRASKGSLAVNSYGAGFDGMVAKLTNDASYKKLLNRIALGKLAYFLTILRVYLTYKPCGARLTVDNQTHHIPHMWLAAIVNIRFYGGGIPICPTADPTDGEADILVISSRSRLKLLPILFTVYRGKHTRHPAVFAYKGKRIHIEAEGELLIQADGEFAGVTPLSVETVPQAMPIIRGSSPE